MRVSKIWRDRRGRKSELGIETEEKGRRRKREERERE